MARLGPLLALALLLAAGLRFAGVAHGWPRLPTRIDPFRSGPADAETLLPLELRSPLCNLWRADRPGPVIEIFELAHR